MAWNLLNNIFDYFGIYYKISDINKDVDGRGTYERYHRSIAQDFDDNIRPLIDDLLANVVSPSTILEKFLDHAENSVGTPFRVNDTAAMRRKVLQFNETILRTKGTRTSFQILYNLLGLNLDKTVVFKNTSGFDSSLTFDDGVRVFDGSPCCSVYAIYLSGDAELTTALIDDIVRVYEYLTPITSRANAIIYNGVQSIDPDTKVVTLVYPEQLQSMITVADQNGYTKPTDDTLVALGKLLYLLNSEGFLDLLSIFYVPYTDGDVNWASLDVKNPSGAHNLVRVNSPVFGTFQGFDGAGTGYLRTNWIPATHGGTVFTDDSAHIFHYQGVSGTGSTYVEAGTHDGTTTILACSYLSNSFKAFTRINAFGSGIGGYDPTDKTGLWGHDRSDANNINLYHQGSLITGPFSSGSDGRPTTELYFLAHNSNGTATYPSNRKQYIFGVGASLSVAQHARFNQLLSNYVTEVTP